MTRGGSRTSRSATAISASARVSSVIATRIDGSAPEVPARRSRATGRAGGWPARPPGARCSVRFRARRRECGARSGTHRAPPPAGPTGTAPHQIHPQPLPKRVFGDQCLELCDQLVVAAEREVGVDTKLDCRQPDLLEPGDRPSGRSSRRRSRRAPGPARARARREAAADASAARPRASRLRPSSTSRSKRCRSSSSGSTRRT